MSSFMHWQWWERRNMTTTERLDALDSDVAELHEIISDQNSYVEEINKSSKRIEKNILSRVNYFWGILLAVVSIFVALAIYVHSIEIDNINMKLEKEVQKAVHDSCSMFFDEKQKD